MQHYPFLLHSNLHSDFSRNHEIGVSVLSSSLARAAVRVRSRSPSKLDVCVHTTAARRARQDWGKNPGRNFRPVYKSRCSTLELADSLWNFLFTPWRTKCCDLTRRPPACVGPQLRSTSSSLQEAVVLPSDPHFSAAVFQGARGGRS